jgi:hypothetical protein
MVAVRLEEGAVGSFLERFAMFEDGVITGIRLHLPRVPAEARSVTFDIQAMDAPPDNAWRLVRITVGGVYEYQFLASKKYSYHVLSDGINLDVSTEGCVLDLDPGPDGWSRTNFLTKGIYSKQYAVGLWCEYEVLDGPFI